MTAQDKIPTTQVNVRWPVPLLGALDDLAASEGATRTDLMIRGAEELLRRHVPTGLEAGLEEAHAAYVRHGARLRRALEDLALTEPEASLICDALNGYHALVEHAGAPTSPATIYAEVHDAALWEKWDVDARTMLGKLRALTPLQAMAIVDAAGRFWEAADVQDSSAVLRVVGFLRS